MDVSIVIPCYNEADNVALLQQRLQPVLSRLRQSRAVELVLVDDGSCDDTAALLHEAFAGEHYVRIVRHTRNRGLGAAVRTGCAAAQGAVVVTTDSDSTYAYEEIPTLLAHLTPHVDIVTASPYHPRGGVVNVPGYRLLLSRGASLCYRLVLGRHIHTYTSLFRAYRRSTLQHLSWRSNDYLAVAELLVDALLKGYRVVEYPTVLRVRQYGQSKARVVRIVRSHLAFLAQLLALRLLGRRRACAEAADADPTQVV